jgi:hypothetical protein
MFLVGSISVKCIVTDFVLLQFVMFYACALDPERCGVNFAMVLTEMFESYVNPPITR